MTKLAPRIGSDLLAWAKSKVGSKYDVGMCAQWVIRDGLKIPPPWKWGGNGKPWAMNYALAAQQFQRTTDPTRIPKGQIGFLDGGKSRAGHIFISDGDGWCYSTDGPKDGVIGRVKIQDLCERWNLKVWGWVTIDGMGYTLSEAQSINFLDPANYPPKGPKSGPQILWLGQRLVAHGFYKHYKIGPTATWGEADQKNLKDFQRAQGWTGKDADGYPGPTTLKLLNAAPVKMVSTRSLFGNLAGYNAADKPGVKNWKANVDGIAAIILDQRPDIFDTAELSNKTANPMRPRMDAALKPAYVRTNGGSDGRYNIRDLATTEWVASGTFTVPNDATHRLAGDDKQAAWIIYRRDGALAMDVSCHGENENGTSKNGTSADQIRVNQADYWRGKAIATAKQYGVPIGNILIVGDFNSESWVTTKSFEPAGWKLIGSAVMRTWNGGGKKKFIHAYTIDGVEATASEIDTKFSDHRLLLVDRTLTAS